MSTLREAQVSGEMPLPAVLLQLITGRWVSQIIHVAAKLGIADLLASGAKSSHELAESSGADKPDGTEVSEEDFQSFLDKKVTPLFPDGLTVLTGKGQFRCDAGGQLVQERSFVMVLLYPQETKESSSKKIEQIRKDYKTDFQQQSVLRVDDPRPVRVSF